MSYLPPTNYEVQWMAFIPSGTRDRRRYGRDPESGDAAPGLPWDCALPSTLSCETGSSNGALKGLSEMRGNSHVSFLGGRTTAMQYGYPTGLRR